MEFAPEGRPVFRPVGEPFPPPAPPVETSDAPGGPSIYSVVEKQFGLKLEPVKGPREFLIIDHVVRPTIRQDRNECGGGRAVPGCRLAVPTDAAAAGTGAAENDIRRSRGRAQRGAVPSVLGLARSLQHRGPNQYR